MAALRPDTPFNNESSPKRPAGQLEEISEELADLAESAAREAGHYVSEKFREGVSAEEKAGYQDLVTEHDRAAERLITQQVMRKHPDSTIIGEEGGRTGNGTARWYVDPIDGTSNFAVGVPFYCVSIGVVLDDQLVAAALYDPERDEMFRASKSAATLNGSPLIARGADSDNTALLFTGFPYEGGHASAGDHEQFSSMIGSFRSVRRLGSSALGLAYVAAGRGDVALDLSANPWDIAAGLFLVQQAGGHFVTEAEASDAPWDARRYVASVSDFDVTQSCIRDIVSHPVPGARRPL